MMNRYLAYGNQFFVFVDLLNLFLLEDIQCMSVGASRRRCEVVLSLLAGARVAAMISKHFGDDSREFFRPKEHLQPQPDDSTEQSHSYL